MNKVIISCLVILLTLSCHSVKKSNLIMEQRLSVLTLGADDLPAMRKFYEEKLGWKPVAENKDIVFYQMNGFLFSLGKRRALAGFIGINPEGSGFRGVTIGYNVTTELEVREIYEDLKKKGVKILNAPSAPPFGGLFFYFEDLEGNIIEVAYNTFIPLDKNNNATGHKSIDHL
jgi:catechol 2,3-dioxygenase-like lactoylglutathione lyase family enzyme